MDSLKIDASTKASNVNLPSKKDASSSDAVSCISSGDAASTVKESEMNQEASIGDQGMYYYGYYYPGSYGGWDENGYFVGYNGLEMHPAVVQGDNGSYLCYLPGYESGYASYTPVVPGGITSADGQYVSKEPYYSTAIPMQDPSTPGIFAQPIAYGPELVPAYSWDPSFVLLDGVQGHPVGGHQTNYAARPKYSSNKHGFPSSKAARSAKYAPETIKGSSSALETLPNAANSIPLSKGANKNKAVLMRMGKFTGITCACAIPPAQKDYVPVSKMPPINDQIVIGTSGTLSKWITNKKVATREIKILVFDEADHMLAEPPPTALPWPRRQALHPQRLGVGCIPRSLS